MRRVDSLLSILQRRLYKTGETVFFQGERPNNAYIVRSGSVRIFNIVGRKTNHLTTILPNQIFGELALFSALPRSATAVAAEPTELIVITQEDFKAKTAQLDVFMKNWLNYLIGRIYDLSERIEG
jgi:CRP-like cAMP-binding protein